MLSSYLRSYMLGPNLSPFVFWDLHHYCFFCLKPELAFISSYQFMWIFSPSSSNVKVKLPWSVYELPAKHSLPVLSVATSPLLYCYKPWSRKIKPIFQLVYKTLPISPILFQGHYFQLEYWTKWSSVPPKLPLSCSWFHSHLRGTIKCLYAAFSLSMMIGENGQWSAGLATLGKLAHVSGTCVEKQQTSWASC